MSAFAVRFTRFIQQPLGPMARLSLVAATALILVAHFLPLWNLTMFAPQYPHGLRLDIFDHALAGGNGGQDIKEINLLNHYIGMRDLAVEDFTEFQWMPFAFGGIGLLMLRAAVLGTVKEMVDAVVVAAYFGAFSLWSFGYRMYRYGHDLAPDAAVKVDPFTPPLFGYQKIANFEVYSYPQAGSYALVAVMVLLAAAVFQEWRRRPGPGPLTMPLPERH
jgi:copper chaperone NosL